MHNLGMPCGSAASSSSDSLLAQLLNYSLIAVQLSYNYGENSK